MACALMCTGARSSANGEKHTHCSRPRALWPKACIAALGICNAAILEASEWQASGFKAMTTSSVDGLPSCLS